MINPEKSPNCGDDTCWLCFKLYPNLLPRLVAELCSCSRLM